MQSRREKILPNTSALFSCTPRLLTIHFQSDEELQFDVDENITFPTLHLTAKESFIVNRTVNLHFLQPLSSKIVVKADLRRPLLSISKAVVKNAEETAAVSSVATSLSGSPTMAVQGARTAMILDFVDCEDNTEDELGWMEHPTGYHFPYVERRMQQFAGACLMNPAVVVGLMFLHLLVAQGYFTFSSDPTMTAAKARSNLFFPALHAIVILPLLQPTVMSATTLFRQSSEKVSYVIGGGVFLMTLFMGIYLFRVTANDKFFGARFRRFRKKNQPHAVYRFFSGDGEWKDKRRSNTAPSSPSGDSQSPEGGGNGSPLLAGVPVPPDADDEEALELCKEPASFCDGYFLFFDVYRSRRQWFGIIEGFATVVFGVIEGWRPGTEQGCTIISFVLAAALMTFFLVLVLLRPYLPMFDVIVGFFLAGVQAVVAVFTAVYHVTSGGEDLLNYGGYGATAAMYSLAGKALADLAFLFYDLVLSKLCGGDNEPSSNADATEGDGKTEDELMFETSTQQQPDSQVSKSRRAILDCPVSRPDGVIYPERQPDATFGKKAPMNPILAGVKLPPPPPGPPPMALKAKRKVHRPPNKNSRHWPRFLEGNDDEGQL